jgi:triosephosphate isomerase
MHLNWKNTGRDMVERRIRVIVGNWKMHTTIDEAVRLVNDIRFGLDEFDNVKTVICPPFVSLSMLKEILAGSPIKLGAQDVFYEEKGAYTGEISPGMLSGLCQYVIIGHSERRAYFHETDEIVNLKLKAAIHHGLKPIMCVGENLAENESGATDCVIKRQLTLGLAGIESADFLIAYEPIWAIGTGRAATGTHANKVMSYVRAQLAEIYDQKTAACIPLLYGGSVNADNVAEFLSQTDIDGALIGGASLKPAQFLSIVRQASESGRL